MTICDIFIDKFTKVINNIPLYYATVFTGNVQEAVKKILRGGEAVQ